ncbi:MAG: hypothetical protein H0Z33_15220 [Bacillaceae bacterium]|nr:hypothetical protein [Bacillaceae bacterium]
MESLSRVEKYGKSSSRRKKSGGKGAWIYSTILFIISVVLLIRFMRIPADPGALQALESTLFFFSGLFLVIYLASFMSASGQYSEEQIHAMMTPNRFVIALGMLSTFFHLGLLLRLPSVEQGGIYLYQFAIICTVGGFLYGIVHYIRFFVHMSDWKKDQKKKQSARRNLQGREMLRDCLKYERMIREVVEKDTEIQQVFRWNRFDTQLEELMKHIEPYFQVDFFSEKDLDHLATVMESLKNIILVVEQHPRYRHLTHTDIDSKGAG